MRCEIKDEELDLNFENLAQIGNGGLEAWLMSEIRRCCQDMLNRPTHHGVREVTVKFKFKSIPEVNGREVVIRKAQVGFHCSSKVPATESPPYEMRVGMRGLTFNPDFPDSLDQKPLPTMGVNAST